MARKTKKSDSGSTNGVMEAEAPELDSTEVPEESEPIVLTTTEKAELAEALDLTVPDLEAKLGKAEAPAPGPIDRPQPEAKPAQPEPDPLWTKLVELQKQADAIHAEYLELAEEAKAKKKGWEAKTEEVLALIRSSAKPMPLFEGKPEADAEAVDAEERVAEEQEVMATEPVILRIAGVPDATAEAIGVEDFETIPIWALVDFGMPKKYVQILSDGGVDSIGDVKRLGDRGLDLTEVKGVGESARDKINAAMDAMWKARSEAKAEASTPAGDWVDPDAQDDFEDWHPDDRVGLTDAEAAGLDAASLDEERERREEERDPVGGDMDEYDPDWAAEDPNDDAETDVSGDPDDEDFEREDADEGAE